LVPLWGKLLPHILPRVLVLLLIGFYSSAVKTNQLGRVLRPVCFRYFLQAELARRCARNAQYSLRAFAKFLDVDHSTLSQIIRGKRRLTERTVRRCGVRLGLDEESIEEFIRAIGSEDERDDAALGEIRVLASDTAKLVAEWQHYAILELVRLPGFRPDSRWIARVLGLSIDEVNISLQRLLRLGLLSMDARDRWTDRTGDATASVRGFTQSALEQLLRQSRERLLASFARSSAEQCVFSSSTVAVSIDRLAEVSERVERFCRDLLRLVRRDASPNAIYQLEISFLPLTQPTFEEPTDGTARDSLADRDEPAG
jgi:uncharacterized protein (TIGR02147 family)